MGLPIELRKRQEAEPQFPSVGIETSRRTWPAIRPAPSQALGHDTKIAWQPLHQHGGQAMSTKNPCCSREGARSPLPPEKRIVGALATEQFSISSCDWATQHSSSRCCSFNPTCKFLKIFTECMTSPARLGQLCHEVG
jgi:hypothetical protein